MTPEEAQWLLDKCHQPDADLPHIMDGKDTADAVETIANLTWEYAVIDRGMKLSLYHQTGDGLVRQTWGTEAEARDRLHPLISGDAHLVRRLVSQSEKVQP